jgi:hypothetical protein
MSWSVSAIGKSAAVAAKLAKDFTAIKCTEPEETIKNKVAEAVAAGLAAFPVGMAVRVEASGSQYAPDSSKPTELQNQLKVELMPLFGFIDSAPSV